MAQLFSRRADRWARVGLILTVLAVVGLGLGFDRLQRSPWVTRQGERPPQPVPFSHQRHVEVLGVQCAYCHTTADRSSYAGIPSTKICMNCHSQIWTNAQVLEPVRKSWTTGEPIRWTKVNDLPDYVYFSHEIHVAKGVGCATCHGPVNQMQQTYSTQTLQMEWCLDCHRNPAKYLRPTSEIYNMNWAAPSENRPVWCAAGAEKNGVPTAGNVACTAQQPAGEIVAASFSSSATVQKFTSQQALGSFLATRNKIRSAQQLTSCEVCHR